MTFGTPATASRETPNRERPARITAVRFSGAPGVPDADLLSQLRLHVGDPFDFYRWQDDRDGLQRYYNERGFREARVRARRQVQARVDRVLEYAIDAGPLTTLSVRGYDLPGSIRREIEAAWTRSVVDEFLIEDIEMRIRLDLVDDGYVGANVKAAVHEVADAKDIVAQIDPGARSARRRLEFTGNQALSTDELQTLVRQSGLDRTVWVDPQRLERSIRARYAAAGLLNATLSVQSPEFRGDEAVLPVVIDEGPVFRLAAFESLGVDALPAALVHESAGLAVGDVFSEARLEDARFRIERDYREAGFNAVEVTSERTIDRDAADVSVEIQVREGLQQVLGDVRVSGAGRTHLGVINRALRFQIGEPVNLGDWYQARRRLYDTGVFRSVEISPEPMVAANAGGEETVRARVELREWPAFQLRYGFQLNDERAPEAQPSRGFSLGVAGDLTRQNLFGRAAVVGLSARYSARFTAARAFASMPTLGPWPILSNVFLSRSREELGEGDSDPFVTDRTSLTLEQRIRPSDTLGITYGYTFERNHTFELDAIPNDPFAFDITVDVARLAATARVDTRDDLVDATAGWFHSSSVEYGPERLGSDLRFAKYLAQQFYYTRVGGYVVLASAARVGVAAGFGQELIRSERFFAGGGYSVRGYPEDSLGPHDFFGASGGNALLVLNQEVRFPIAWRFRGVGFIDAGNVFPRARDLSFAGLRVGYGLGLRIDSPFALLRVDYGRRVRESSRRARGPILLLDRPGLLNGHSR